MVGLLRAQSRDPRGQPGRAPGAELQRVVGARWIRHRDRVLARFQVSVEVVDREDPDSNTLRRSGC